MGNLWGSGKALLCRTCMFLKWRIHIGHNPTHVYLEVSPGVLGGAYSWERAYRDGLES